MNSPACLPPVLVVDDDPDALYFIRRQFEKACIQNPLITVVDAEDAIKYLEGRLTRPPFADSPLPCIIFTDLKMPGMDGHEFVRWIRRRPEFDDIKVVVLSTSDRPCDIARATAGGADRYIVKYPGVDVFSDIVTAASSILVTLSV